MSQMKTGAFRAALILLTLGLSACGPSGETKLTRELLSLSKDEAYARGEALVSKKKYEQGRRYLQFVAETYPNDAVGRQAVLRLADTYFEEGGPVGYMEAETRFRDFRNRFPSHPKADYALLRLAQCHDRQAERPDRDQTHTRQAANAYRDLVQGSPTSAYLAEARARLRAMRTLLAEHEWHVGQFYFRRGAYRAALTRLEVILNAYPEYPDADRVLYHAGLSACRLGHDDDARAFFDKLKELKPGAWLAKMSTREKTKDARCLHRPSVQTVEKKAGN